MESAMQIVTHLSDGRILQLSLPPPDVPIANGIHWGRHDELCSPAYWAAQAWMWELEEPEHFRLGRTLQEELLACILGGYGIPAEVGMAAYDRLRPWATHQTSRLCDETLVRDALTAPLSVKGRVVRYRFANQKARYISAAFRQLDSAIDALPDRGLRDQLMRLSGVGPKTASWVVRNLRSSDEVAILDVHLLRAGRMLGIFGTGLNVEKHYSKLEDTFLQFASAIGSRSSILDSVIWMTMRRLPQSLLRGMITETGDESPVRVVGGPQTFPVAPHLLS
jgi:N-glycosylase/DNA lyase